jgi:hypothetical protein
MVPPVLVYMHVSMRACICPCLASQMQRTPFSATDTLMSHLLRPIQKLEHARDSVTSVAIDGHEIYSASVDGCLRCYDLRAGRMRHDDVKEAVTHVR